MSLAEFTMFLVIWVEELKLACLVSIFNVLLALKNVTWSEIRLE